MIRIFHHYVSRHLLVQMAIDFMALWVAVSFAAIALDSGTGWQVRASVKLGFVLAVATLLIAFIAGLYQRGPIRAMSDLVKPAVMTSILAIPLAYVGIMALRGNRTDSSAALVLAVLIATAFVVTYRAQASRQRPGVLGSNRVLILGAGRGAQLVAQTLRASDRHSTIVGFYPVKSDAERFVPEADLVDASMPLASAAAAAKATEIVVAITERRGGAMALDELLACRSHGVRVSDLSTYFERTQGQIRLDHVHAGWLIFGDGFNQGTVRTAVKRLFDIVSAMTLVVLSLPILLLTVILIKLDSRGPILYRQERTGLDGQPFQVLKLRSMVQDAERAGQPQWAVKADARVTRVGRVIRLLRIDELPQLFNVLRGEMSLVGPRPERPVFVNLLTEQVPYYALRHSVKPGLTGWAQVRYQYGGSVEDAKEKLQFDLYYVKNHTLFLDLLILLKTINVVLTGKGAR